MPNVQALAQTWNGSGELVPDRYVRTEEAVAEEVRERRRQDAARAAERLGGLIADRVRREAGLRRQDAGDGGASGQHAGARAPRRGQQS